MDSLILSPHQETSLLALTGLKEARTFSLLWRGSKDGFDHKTFHRLCDGQGKTLLVIKNTNGYIFGGFTSVPWSSPSSYCYRTDSTAFLFSLTNSSGTPLKLKVTEPEKAVEHSSSFGPMFGGGRDLMVEDESSTYGWSYMNLYSYELPKGKRGREGGQFIVGGEDHEFQIDEIEMFKVQ